MYSSLYLYGDWEPNVTSLFMSLITVGDTVFDVGANFGWYTAVAAQSVGADGAVHAFEPVPRICDLLEETVELNSASSVVKVNRLGLGSNKNQSELTVYTFRGLPHGRASSDDQGRKDAAPNSCKMTTLDSYCAVESVEHIDVMKVDVEGFEPEVLRGGTRVLREPDAPLLILEVAESILEYRGLTPADVEKILRNLGYDHFFAIPPSGGLERVARLGVVATNYLAVKTSRLGRVMGVADCP